MTSVWFSQKEGTFAGYRREYTTLRDRKGSFGDVQPAASMLQAQRDTMATAEPLPRPAPLSRTKPMSRTNVQRMQWEEAIRVCDREIAAGVNVEANEARRMRLQRALQTGEAPTVAA